MTTTRHSVKRAGGRVIAYQRAGSDLIYQVWELPDGRLFLGVDWYHDVRARLHEVDGVPDGFKMAEWVKDRQAEAAPSGEAGA